MNAAGVVGRGGMAAELVVADPAVEILSVMFKTFKHFKIHNKENR